MDKDTGLAHTLKATAANVHDVTVTAQMLKQTAKLNMAFAPANLILADRPCLTA